MLLEMDCSCQVTKYIPTLAKKRFLGWVMAPLFGLALWLVQAILLASEKQTGVLIETGRVMEAKSPLVKGMGSEKARQPHSLTLLELLLV